MTQTVIQMLVFAGTTIVKMGLIGFVGVFHKPAENWSGLKD